MIVFNLTCQQQHRFEGWFRSSDAYAAQRASKAVQCPVCGCVEISKLLTAPRLNLRLSSKAEGLERDANSDGQAQGAHHPAATPSIAATDADSSALATTPDNTPPKDWDGTAAQYAHIENAVRALRHKIKSQTEDVGGRFADVARAMHQGQEEERGIRGTVTPAQADALADEGIATTAVPPGFFDDEKLH